MALVRIGMSGVSSEVLRKLSSDPTTHVAISNEERAFFIAFGERLAALRKTQSLTQVQLAERLEVSQQAITAYESGLRRVPISMLLALADTFDVNVEEPIGTPACDAGNRRPAPKLQQLEQLGRLPKARQKLVSTVIDSVLAQAGR